MAQAIGREKEYRFSLITEPHEYITISGRVKASSIDEAEKKLRANIGIPWGEDDCFIEITESEVRK